MLHHMLFVYFLSRHSTFLAFHAYCSSWIRLKSLLTAFCPMLQHMMHLKFLSRHHMVFGILCTLTVPIFEQHRTQLRFRPRTSTCFRQCQVLVSRKMSFPIHFDFSLLSCIFFYSLSDEITVHGYVKIPFNHV